MTDFNLVYLSRSRYGGWVTFTSNLVLKYNFNLFKITNRTEKTKAASRKRQKNYNDRLNG